MPALPPTPDVSQPGSRTDGLARDPDEAYVRNELTLLILRTASWHWVPHIGVALIVVGRLGQAGDWRALGLWAAALSVVVFGQSAYSRKVLRAGRDPQGLRRGLQGFLLSSALVGLLWSYMGFGFFPQDQPLDQIFITLTIGGASLAGVGMLHMSLWAQTLALGPPLFVLGLSHFLAGGPNGLATGVLVWVFFGMMTILGLQLNGFARQRIVLQKEKDDLIANLRNRTLELDAARRSEAQANMAKTNFIAHASHDLRQPLHAMGLFLDSLPEALEPPGVNHAIEQVRRSQRQLSELFDSLMDVTVIEAQQVEVQPEPVLLDGLFRQVVAEFRPMADAQGAALSSARTGVSVRADPQLLHRMVRNLVSNAIHYGQGARVLIGVRRRSGRVVIEVHDQGPGIPETDQQRVFEEFARLESATRRTDPGLGLGLTIVSSLARLQGLTVSLRSEVGRGSVFAIGGLRNATVEQTLPEVRGSAPDVAGAPRILVIDDDPKVRAATTSLLRKWGFRVEAVAGWSGDLHQPDILLCDYDLGGVEDGLQVIDTARAVFGRGVQAALVTGATEPKVAEMAAARGIPVLRKPFRPAQLRSAILMMQSQGAARSAEA